MTPRRFSVAALALALALALGLSLGLSRGGLSADEQRYAAYVSQETGLSEEAALQAAEDWCTAYAEETPEAAAEAISYLDNPFPVVTGIIRFDLC